MFDEPIVAESCESIDKFYLDYQNQELVTTKSHVMSYDKGSSIQETLSIARLPCNEVEENTRSDNLFVDIMSHKNILSINFKSFSSPSLVIESTIFYDHNISTFIIYENPSFGMNIFIDHHNITSPSPFMLNFNNEEFIQEFIHTNMEEFFHVDYITLYPMSNDHNTYLSIGILHKKSNIL